MFDKLKEAVSDLIGKNDDVAKAVDSADSAVDDVKTTAGSVVDDATKGGVSADSLKSAAGDIGGLKDRLTSDANGLGAIAGQLGGLGELTKYVQNIHFPIDKDQLIAQLKENGSFGEIVDKLQTVAKERFGSQAELLDTVKGFLSK